MKKYVMKKKCVVHVVTLLCSTIHTFSVQNKKHCVAVMEESSVSRCGMIIKISVRSSDMTNYIHHIVNDRVQYGSFVLSFPRT